MMPSRQLAIACALARSEEEDDVRCSMSRERSCDRLFVPDGLIDRQSSNRSIQEEDLVAARLMVYRLMGNRSLSLVTPLIQSQTVFVIDLTGSTWRNFLEIELGPGPLILVQPLASRITSPCLYNGTTSLTRLERLFFSG